jgi:hypothetical protein
VSTINPGIGRLLAAGGGTLLIAALFMSWAEDPGGATQNGWEFWTAADVVLAITAALGIAAGVTGGRFGFFRPDLSLNATADIAGVLASVLVGWLILFDFPSGADPEAGAYLALAAALAIACGAGDFRVSSAFPPMPDRRVE